MSWLYTFMTPVLLLVASCAGPVTRDMPAPVSGQDTPVIVSADEIPEPEPIRYRRPEGYNVRISIADSAIADARRNRRSFYRVLIDGEEAGRTTIAQESAPKTLDLLLAGDRHRIRLEKYVLDERNERYERVRDTQQPALQYTLIPDPERILLLKIDHQSGGRTVTIVEDFERE
jgi:hypothetical protein